MSVKEKFEAILRKYNINAYYHQGLDMCVPNVTREIDLYCDDRKRAKEAAKEFLPLFNTLGQEEGDDGACFVLIFKTKLAENDNTLLRLGKDY